MLMKKLSDYAEVISGFAFDSNLFNDVKGMPLVRIRDIRRGYTETYTTEEYKDEYIIKKDDILIGMDGEFNISKWKSDDALLNQRVCKVNPINTCNGDFIYYSLPFKLKEIENSTSFATVKHISLKQILNIDIPDYSLEEQNKIAMKLNLINNMINNKKHQLFKLDELIKSQFVEMFGSKQDGFKYDKVKFNNCTESMLKGPFGSDIKKSLYVPKTADTYKVYIQINAIKKDESLGNYYISKKYFDEKMYKFEVKPLDYIVTCDGTLGKLLRLDSKMEKGIISASLLKITLNNKINYKYFEEIWNQYMLNELSRDIRNACLTHLPSAKVIESMEIPLPPLELQNKFAKFVEQVDKQKFEFEKQLKKLEELQASLMQEYFG